MKDFIKAFKTSVPVLFSYIILGIGCGVLMANMGYHWLWTFFSSLTIYAGAGQYAMAGFLAEKMPLYMVFFMIFAINVRHVFYGISFLNKAKNYKWYEKLYFYFAMTDETYSLLVATSMNKTEDTRKYDMWLSFLNHSYWIIGTVLGVFLGKLPIDFTGVDFIMTALFVIIFIDQLRVKDNPHIVSLIGAGCAVISYLIFRSNFIFPALVAATVLIFIFRKPIEKNMKKEEKPLNEETEDIVNE